MNAGEDYKALYDDYLRKVEAQLEQIVKYKKHKCCDQTKSKRDKKQRQYIKLSQFEGFKKEEEEEDE